MPPAMRLKVRGAYKKSISLSLDLTDWLLGRRDELTPPRRKRFYIGAGDFNKIGQEFLRYFTGLGELKPNARVLDVGCGIGRMAVPLISYLDHTGRYEGFDIVADEINWCQEEITSRHPNFSFQWVDIYNRMYNPNGKCQASEFKFPYADESFDFIFLTSVFTHMLPAEIENYFAEIVRVLKKGGRCLITFFILNTESMKLIEAKLSTEDFSYGFDGFRSSEKNLPEAVIAYEENQIRRLYDKYRLQIAEPVRYGSWCGRKSFLSYQDIIVSVKN